MRATFSITSFNRYEKVVVQFLTKGRGIFNITGFKIEFLSENKIMLYYTGSQAVASYIMKCDHDIQNKIISTDYFRFTQILKALAFDTKAKQDKDSEDNSEDIQVSFTLNETKTGAIIKIDNASTHIDLPAFIVTEDFSKIISYSEENVICTLDDPELYNAAKVASSFLTGAEPGASVAINSSAISNDVRYVYVAKKKWGEVFEEEVNLSKQNLDIFGVLKSIDKNASYKYIVSDKIVVHMCSESKDFNVQIGEPDPVTAAPTEDELEKISTSVQLAEIPVSTLSSIINFFLSTGIFDGQKWFPLTIQSLIDEKKIKFTVKNTQYTSVPALNVERWITVDELDVASEDTISADILKIFLGLLSDETIIKIYNDPKANGIRFETPDQDLYLAKSM